MKRIFSILAVVCLVVALAVPAFATENDEELPMMSVSKGNSYTYHSVFDVGSFVDLPLIPNQYWDKDNIVIGYSQGTYQLYVFDGPIWLSYGSALNICTNVGSTITYHSLEGSNWSVARTRTVSSTSSAASVVFGSDYVLWTYNDIGVIQISGTTYEVLGDSNYVYFVEPECDGSTCAATDINFDDICDECGMPLAYNLRQTPDSYEVVVKHSDDLTLLYRYTERIDGTTFSAVYNDSRVTISFNNPVDHYQYKLVNGEWEEYASYPNEYDNHTISLPSTATIESSDLIVYDTAGNVFFQNPLWKMILGLTQGEMTTAAQAVVGTMRVLVLCGVGLIALLVVLKLFGKRSLLYRG